MIVHIYDTVTKEYLGDSIAFPDPVRSEREGHDVFAFPADSTLAELIPTKEGYTRVFNEKDNKWELVEDHRGKIVYDKKTAKEIIVENLGKIPSNYTFEKPVTFNELKTLRIEEIKKKAEEVLEETVVIGKIEKKAKEWADLATCAEVPANFRLIPVFLDNKDIVFVTKEELDEAVKYLYIRCMLLTLKKKELLKEISSVKNKKQLQAFEVDFNVDKEIKEYMKLSEDELNEKFSEVIE